MKKAFKNIRPVLFCFIIMTIICGIIYPTIVTGIAQAVFPNQANGSIITVSLEDQTKKDYGCALIAQEFTKPEYLIGRPLGTSNLSPVGKEQEILINDRIKWWHSFDPENNVDIPMDLVTGSASGVDPNISPEAAEYQVARIAKERNIDENHVKNIIEEYTTERLLGFWGEPGVNVLKVNLALDELL